MREMEIVSEKEIKLKKIGWKLTPRFARQAFIMEIVMIPITITISLTLMGFAKVFHTIPLTITLSVAIIAGIAGIVLGSLSLRDQKTVFGIIGLVLGIVITLYNAFLMFILHCDAWFSIPY
ncbi:MAG TPA: hypothetical protein VMX55_10255 [candidate division Zixibacteria bacterium]|nr:hypothetical protein [candidate division Zixibacteria bacterium]